MDFKEYNLTDLTKAHQKKMIEKNNLKAGKTGLIGLPNLAQYNKKTSNNTDTPTDVGGKNGLIGLPQNLHSKKTPNNTPIPTPTPIVPSTTLGGGKEKKVYIFNYNGEEIKY